MSGFSLLKSTGAVDAEGVNDGLWDTVCEMCHKPVGFSNARQCAHCIARGDPASGSYCITCEVEDCKSRRYCSVHSSCWDQHLPRHHKLAERHQQIDPLSQLFVWAVTHSDSNVEKVRQVHEQDENARWINVRRNEAGRLEFYISDRFMKACCYSPSGENETSNAYPNLVSFVGDTSVGKSTLVRAMLMLGQSSSLNPILTDSYLSGKLDRLIEVFWEKGYGPVTRSANIEHLTHPTTSGIRLYPDTGSGIFDEVNKMPFGAKDATQYPILFSDCEGFGAGEALTNAERMEFDPPGLESLERTSTHQRNSRQTTSTWKVLKSPSKSSKAGSSGKAWIDLFYAKFLYAMSDVIVFVTKDDQKIQVDLTLVLERAAMAVRKSVNDPSQKTLIIVRHISFRHEPALYNENELERLYLRGHLNLWDDSPILSEFVDTYNRYQDKTERQITSNESLYKVLFHNIRCCYIPQAREVAERPQELYIQYRKLRQLVDLSVREGIKLRERALMKFNVPQKSHIIDLAFAHFSSSEMPLDFHLVAREAISNSKYAPEHFANFLRHIEHFGKNDTTKRMVFDVMALSLVVWVQRNFDALPDPSVLFERDLQEICEEEFSLYNLYSKKIEPCLYKFPSGASCIARPRNLHNHHISSTGQTAPGISLNYGSSTQDERRLWISEIRKRFEVAVLQMDVTHRPEREHLLQCQRRELYTQYHVMWVSIRCNKTCLSCLRAVPHYVLDCGHSYCALCIQELGITTSDFVGIRVMSSCILCGAYNHDDNDSEYPRTAPDALCDNVIYDKNTQIPLSSERSDKEAATQTNLDEQDWSEAETAPSISNTVFSLESADTLSTRPTTEGQSKDEPGISGIVNLLTTDEALKLLYAKALKSSDIDSTRFQRNFRRILRQFSVDLREELDEGLEQIPDFIRSYKGAIGGRIWAAIDQRSEGIRDLKFHETLDAELKIRRLETYLAQSLPAAAMDFIRTTQNNHMDSEDDQPFEADSASEPDGSSGKASGDENDAVMRYSESLENVLRQSQALRNLRANLHSWMNPKASMSRNASSLESLHRALDSTVGQENLLDFIFHLAFVPREHLVHASIMEQGSLSLIDRLKVELEVYTKQPWDWWPLSPPSIPLGDKNVIIAWECNCGHSKTAKIEMKILQYYLRDFQVSDPSEESLPKVTIKLLPQSIPSPVNPPPTENQGAKLQLPRYRTIPAASKAPVSLPGQVDLRNPAGSQITPGSQNIPPQKPSVSGNSSSPLHAVQGSSKISTNRVQMPNGEHVLLAVNRGHHLQLAQIDRREWPEDGQFFTKLKEEYKIKRGMLRRWLDVKQFHHCEFVEFEKPCYRRIIRRRKGYPHDAPHHLSLYSYKPTAKQPQWKDPPILPDEFYDRFYGCSNCMILEMAYLHRCSHFCPSTIDRVDRIPKRTIPLEFEAQGQEEAWGLHAIEYVNLVHVVVYHIVMLAGPLIFWGLWLWYWGHKADLQNATVPLVCMIPVLSFFWALLKGN